MNNHSNIRIIGGGLSGLSAGVFLAEAGFRVTVFEANSVLGGRLRSVIPNKDADAISIDWGQHLMLGAYRETTAFTKKLGTIGDISAVKGITPFVSADGIKHNFSIGRMPAPFHMLGGVMAMDHLSVFDRMMLGRAALGAVFGYKAQREKLDNITVGDFLRKHGQSDRTVSGFWEPFTLATLNTPVCDASAALLSAVLVKGMISGRRNSMPILPKGTYNDLLIAPAVSYIKDRGGRVVTGIPIERINTPHGIAASIVDTRGKEYPADMILLALAPWDCVKLLKRSGCCDRLAAFASTLEPSPIVSVDLWYDRIWFKHPYAAFLGSDFHWIFDHQRELTSRGFRISLVISAANDIEALPNEEIVKKATDEIGRYFPESKKARITGSFVVKEKRATFRAVTGMLSRRPGPATDIENIFLAGDWTDTGLPATIEGALISGRKAAETAIRAQNR